jgi:N-acetylglucosamine-6-phosphate deacetylase
MARLWLHDGVLLDPEASEPARGSLLLEDGRIAARFGPEAPTPEDVRPVDLGGAFLAPGFLDVHHHGTAIFGPASELRQRLRHDAAEMLRHGVTGFLATSVTLPCPELAAFVTQASAAVAAPGEGLDNLLGLHLEGPWISPEAVGAHAPGAVRPLDSAEIADVLDRGAGAIRMLTFAPELAGAAELQHELARRGIVGALGHSMTQAPAAERVIASGARHVTHLYNAMTRLHHREPGLAGLALSDERLTCDLICDGVHVDPRVVRFTARALGERLLLISDRVAPEPGSGLGSGPLHDDGAAWRLADGRLAGSRLTLERAAVNLRKFAGVGPCEAVAACTLRPARLLGVEAERGTLRPGARADFAVLGSDGGLRETWAGGRRVHPS